MEMSRTPVTLVMRGSIFYIVVRQKVGVVCQRKCDDRFLIIQKLDKLQFA